ncbi:MAG: hypothetical protein ABI649_03050 [Gaiellaceae bacterium]
MTEPLNQDPYEAYWRPLGELLVVRGLIAAEDLEAALAEQDQTGGRLGEILLARGLLSKLALASTLGEQATPPGQTEAGFGSGLRGAIDGTQQLGREVEDAPVETERGFGSGLREALEASEQSQD